MCDCVCHVCANCCCVCSCFAICLLIVMGSIIIYAIYKFFGYLESKNKIENEIDKGMIKSLTKEVEEKGDRVWSRGCSYSDGKTNP